LIKENIYILGEDTPLHCAAQNNHLDVVYCVRNGLIYFDFYISITNAKIIFKKLIKNKANTNASNIHGNTALHYCKYLKSTFILLYYY
jgi:ankyrin repeat protein